MNNWYIDRSKNFYTDNFDEILDILNVHCKNEIKTDEVLEVIDKKGALKKAIGNPNAAMTRFRDHGLLSSKNKIGDSAQDYCNEYISLSELIIDLFLKRPAKKENSPNVKPFVILCKIFSIMFEMGIDIDDIFLTYSECYEYLYNIDDYESITYEFVEKIILERSFKIGERFSIPRLELEENDKTNLSIWFNALNMTSLFLPAENIRSVLIPNSKQKEFFKYISVNAEELMITPTSSNSELYKYFCNRNTGFNEILPDVISPDCIINSNEEVVTIFEYLFGFKKSLHFDYDKYLKKEYFGIFFPFITIPRLAIRKILMSNNTLGIALLDLIKNKYTYYLDLFEKGMFEYEKDSNKKIYLYSNRKNINNLTINELGELLNRYYYGATSNMMVASIHMFGIDYGKSIIENNYSINEIIKYSKLKESFSTELRKGVNIYKCLCTNKYMTKYVINENIHCINRLKGGFNKIFYGIPGCGKSYTISSMLKYKNGFENIAEKHGITSEVNEENIIRTTFYLDYTNTDFVGQILPKIEKDEEGKDIVTYKPVPGPFTKALARAYDNPGEMVYLVIEEINRGNAAAIFGDIFQLLDRKKDDDKKGESEYPIFNQFIESYLEDQEITAPYGNENIVIPSNLTILATMNTSDQNVFPLDTAFTRRWKKERIVTKVEDTDIGQLYVPGTDRTWANFVSNINKHIVASNQSLNAEDKQIGAFFIDKSVLSTEENEKFEVGKTDKIDEFCDKVLHYIWEDVSKFERESWFKTLTEDFPKSYEDVLDAITGKNGNNNILSVFDKDKVFKYYQMPYPLKDSKDENNGQ